MPENSAPTRLWTPSSTTIAQANLTRYQTWLQTHHALSFDSYQSLWQWSIDDPNAFWQSIWDFCGIVASRSSDVALADARMPGAVWFPGARLNYAENVFARANDQRPALLYQAEGGSLTAISWAELRQQTAAMQATLRAMGVGKGDRVCAYLPHIPEAIVACLATVSLGAIWSSASPDFGTKAVLDRFSQIEPSVLIAVDGYRYNGRDHDRRSVLSHIQEGLPSLTDTILIPSGISAETLPVTTLWQSALNAHPNADLTFEQLPFDHPLWILYSSGTTGLPKAIVHGHGGNLLEHAKALTLHNDIHPGERFFWYTSTGWMMWNYLVGSLLAGATAVVYNGSPSFPDLNRLWALAEEAELSYMGLSPAFVAACMKADLRPNKEFDLGRVRAIGSTGAPLPSAAFEWLYDHVQSDMAVESLSGGTDLCTAFVGGVRTRPVYAGNIQGASLGAPVFAFDAAGQPVVGEVGELVLTAPMPSMPVRFWNDPDHRRYLASYFEEYPNVWRHGDWIAFNERGGCVIYGRSDATINRKGIRMGTSEIYACVEALDEVVNSLVVDLEHLGRDSFMPLFVVLAEGLTLDDALRAKINHALRTDLSPRHVPNAIYQVDDIPTTLSGKKLEIPVRRILLGQPIEQAANPGAMRNPETLQFYVNLAMKMGA